MEKLKSKKVIAIVIILTIIFIISLFTYKRSNNNIFMDKYVEDIFVDNQEEEQLERGKIGEEQSDLIQDIPKDKDVETINKIIVEIKGEVREPDVYTLNEGSIIKDLIDAAGGLTEESDISNINRAKEIKNHDLIIIRNINDDIVDEVTENIIYDNEDDDGKININNSDFNKLKEIPNIGDVKANAIIRYREENNGFKSIDELKNIDGIGEKTFENIKDFVKL